MGKIKWAIWGTGHICNEFAQGVQQVDNGELCCVLSRTQEKADEFAAKYGIAKAYCDADKMLAEGGADVVYIGTPNRAHYENIMTCIKHKKHVLCEKPIVINMREMEEVLAAAKAADVFLMEGMWTLFFPVIKKVKSWIEAGCIGRPLRATMNFSINSNLDGWRLGAEQAGGALLDLGIYCLTIVDLALGLSPLQTKSMAFVKNGVDYANSVMMKYSDDQIATFTSALDCLSDNKAIIQGETGYIEIRRKFWCPSGAELFKNEPTPSVSSSVEVFEDAYGSTGFQYEAAHVADMLLAGKKESDVVTHQKSRQLTDIMEKLRKEWGMDVE